MQVLHLSQVQAKTHEIQYQLNSDWQQPSGIQAFGVLYAHSDLKKQAIG